MTIDTARYLRISEDRLGDAHGVTNQDTKTTELCDRSGWSSACYMDNDLSATEGGERPEFSRLMADIHAGLITRIVVLHLSRLWRNRRERAEGIEIMRRHAVSIVCVKGPSLDLTSAYGRGMVAMLGEMDTMEVELKAERQELAQIERVKTGLPFAGGPRTWGYQTDRLRRDETEAPFVQAAFERWVGGATLGEICRWLTKEGSVTPRGNAWSTGSLRQVLANPIYAGLRGVRWLEYTKDGKRRRPRFHEIVGPGRQDALVPEETWRAALARVQDPVRGRYYHGRERRYLLPGLAVCATCGQGLKSAFNNGGNASGGCRSVKCPTTRHAHRYAPPIESYVVDVLCWRLERDDANELLTAPVQSVDLRALADEAQAIRERLRSIAADEVLGRRSKDELGAARVAAKTRLDEIDMVIADAGRVDVVAPFVSGEPPRAVWDRSDLSVRRRLLDSLAVVRVGSGRVGRPPKASLGDPPPNVFIDWRRPLD